MFATISEVLVQIQQEVFAGRTLLVQAVSDPRQFSCLEPPRGFCRAAVSVAVDPVFVTRVKERCLLVR